VSSKDGITRLNLLASAIARYRVQVALGEPGEPAWTDGRVVFLDPEQHPDEQLASLTVQASLLASGSLDRAIVRELVRRPVLARRYLALEGRRALAALAHLLPAGHHSVALTSSPAESLAAARAKQPIADPPRHFGMISARRLLDAQGKQDARAGVAHAQPSLVELADDANTSERQDNFSSPVGGGGALGKWLSKLMTAVRQISGGGSPGAESPTHITRAGARARRNAVYSTLAPRNVDRTRVQAPADGTKYAEWDAHERHYRPDWCTVREVDVALEPDAARFPQADRVALRRALARLGLGIDRYHRQAQGDDIDIDAAIEAQVELLAGSAPDENVFINSVRRRRDLSVLLLLDISGSAAEPALHGKTVHEHQRAAAAALTLALHELGDRVALYAYNSQGRESVSVLPIKRFTEEPGALTLQRLGSLTPGAYSRLGAAIRHGTSQLKAHGGTQRQLLVVLSDGLAYDHGYEPAYGASDARRALGEARSQGIGCLCLSIGAETDHDSLRRVFGTSAHAALPVPEQLCHVVGPLFRSAIRSADVRRIVS
jgi:nitric oxide reductase NorD protein